MLHRTLDRGLVGRAGALALLAPAHHDKERVVDRDTESDERDQELHDDRNVREAREGPDEQERGRDRHDRHQQRHQRHERREDEAKDDQRARTSDQNLEQHTAVAVAALAALRGTTKRLKTGDLDRRTANSDAVERFLGQPCFLLAQVKSCYKRDERQPVRRAPVIRDKRAITRRGVRGNTRVGQRCLHTRERRGEFLDDAGRVDRRSLRQRHHRHDRSDVAAVPVDLRHLHVGLERLATGQIELLRQRIRRRPNSAERHNRHDQPENHNKLLVAKNKTG